MTSLLDEGSDLGTVYNIPASEDPHIPDSQTGQYSEANASFGWDWATETDAFGGQTSNAGAKNEALYNPKNVPEYTVKANDIPATGPGPAIPAALLGKGPHKTRNMGLLILASLVFLAVVR